MDKQKALIFLHQSRTAGLAIWAILQEEFGADNVFKLGEVTPEIRHSYEDFKKAGAGGKHQVYAGHFFYGAHRYIQRPCEYFTALRDPVERLLSRYQVSRRLGRAGNDCARWLEKDFESQNGMIKRLLGVGQMEDDQAIYDFMTDKKVSPSMTVGESELKQAMDNLEKHFPCVLLHGRFVESMVLLQTHYQTGPLFSINRQFLNHASTPTRKENYSAHIIKLIQSQNLYDIRLYDEYKMRFQSRLEAGGEAMQNEIRIMDIVSNIVTDDREQTAKTDRVMKRLDVALGILLKTGRADDAVQTLQRFTAKLKTQKPFGEYALGFIRDHGQPADLEDETEKFKERFGASSC